ncbi:MAG: hypothetical protein WCW52_08125 [Elusimicrobiales bacterium]|jgi:hypothetical protein
MGILGKLRVIFWGLIIGLWGLFMYQYVSEDMAPGRKTPIAKNPFSGRPAAERKIRKIHTPATDTRPQPAERTTPDIPPDTHLIGPKAGGLDIKDIGGNTERAAGRTALENEAAEKNARAEEEAPPEAPRGFAMEKTAHFVIYEEGGEVSKDLMETVENLHGNIMLDLVAFSPWNRDRKVFVFFTNTQDAYQRLTGRPAWSGGVSSLSERKIYLFKSEEAFGILAHELTHIYFDSFFPADKPSPLWLSEGMATYIQSERGLSTPRWLSKNLMLLGKGGGFKLNDLVRIEDMRGADEDNVRLWYAQAYSVVRFLMKLKVGDAFYMFCKRLRDGTPVHQALFQAYGMPYNKLASLEYAWRYDMKTGKISGAAR